MNNLKLDFVGIGVARAGTTWIYECLKEHPQICMSKNEEGGFFNSLKEKNRGLKSYPDSYSFNFAHCPEGQIRGEYNPLYLADPEVLHLIKKHYPEIKIIVCLRNPVERAYSHFLGTKLVGEISKTETFEGAIEKGTENDCIKLGFYYSQLKTVFELFPENNILVLINEDIAKNPAKFIQSIYEFLGVDSSFIPSIVNEKLRQLSQNTLRSVLLNKAIRKALEFFRWKPLKPIVVFLKKIGVNRLINLVTSTNYTPPTRRKPYTKPPIMEKDRKRLQEIYSPEIKNLEKLLNKDLSFWH